MHEIAIRNAIAINNIGVQLLSMHCYMDASTTFGAAFAILEEAAVVECDSNVRSRNVNINEEDNINDYKCDDEDDEDVDDDDDDDYDFAVALDALAIDSYQLALERLSNCKQYHSCQADVPYSISVVTWNNCTSSCFVNENCLRS
jgi:hypothetical protein